MEEMKHWQVCGAMPPENKPGYSASYRKNVTAHVIAASARRAIQLVEERHVGIEVHSVTHRGAISIIDDSQA